MAAKGESDANSGEVKQPFEAGDEVASVIREYRGKLEQLAAELSSRVAALPSRPLARVASGSDLHNDVNLEAEEPRRMLHEKVFRFRESLLTSMLNQQSYKSIYHIAIATLIWLGVKLVLQDIRTDGVFIDFGLLTWSFDQSLSVALPAWFCLMAAAFTVLPMIQYLKQHPHSWSALRVVGFLYACLLATLLTTCVYVCLANRLPPATGLIVSCEAVRLSMKCHSYLREKIVHGLRHGVAASAADSRSASGAPTLQAALRDFANHLPPSAAKLGVSPESQRASQPDISIGSVNEEIGRFLYFLFAPTLVYRDHYPRHAGPIDWVSAAVHFLNLIGVVLYTYVLVRGLLTPMLTPVLPKHPIDLLLLVTGVMVPSMLIFLLSFFGILHSWFNLWAELLGFSDKQFYSNWWTAQNWGAYYRRWNMVVGDFLHGYIFNDLQRLGYTRGQAEAGVFLVSAVVHELILATSFKFWYPALLLMFGGPGVVFMRLTKRIAPSLSNIFMWLMLSVGLALLTTVYSRELYARYGYEWADLVPQEKRGLPPYVYDPALHPSPAWGATDWLLYVLLPRSWVEFVKVYYGTP